MCENKDVRAVMKVAEGEPGRVFHWEDSCQEPPDGGGMLRVASGYHYEPGLDAAIPNGYTYDAAAGVVLGPPRTMRVVRTSSGDGEPAPGGWGAIGPITQTPVVQVTEPDPGGGAVEAGVEPPYHPPADTILEHVTPPRTGWLRLGMNGLVKPTNTGNVAILLVSIDAHDNTTNVVMLFPGDTVDWYRIDGSATDIATSIVYPPDGGPRPGDVAELTYVVPVSPVL